MKINKIRLRQTLAEKFANCSRPNWDDFESYAVTKQEYEAAKLLIDKLPDFISHPSITADFDGTFEFSWPAGEKSVVIFRDETKYVLMYKKEEWITEDLDLEKGFPETVLDFIKL